MNPNPNKRPLIIGLVILVVILLAIISLTMMRKQTVAPLLDQSGFTSDGFNQQNPPAQTPTNTPTSSALKYEDTPESKVSYEKSDAYISKYEKKSDGYVYITFDYITYDDTEGVPRVVNNNPALRTFKTNRSLSVSLKDSDVTVPLEEYLGYIQNYNGKYFRVNIAYGIDGGSDRYGIIIKDGLVVTMNEMSEIQG